jgi:hypothetical protein
MYLGALLFDLCILRAASGLGFLLCDFQATFAALKLMQAIFESGLKRRHLGDFARHGTLALFFLPPEFLLQCR